MAEIHEMVTYSGTPAAGTFFAADNGTNTAKLEFPTLTSAIGSALSKNVVAPAVYLDTATWADINAKLTAFNAGRTANFYATGAVASMLTGSKVTSTLRGIISRTNATTYDIMASVGQGATLITVRVSDLSSSGATIGTVYGYTGTAL